MKPSRWLPILLCVVATAAQAAEEATPEAIAMRQIEAMRAMDWTEVAKYTHPRALTQIKDLFLPLAIVGATQKNAAAAQMMGSLFSGKTADQLAALPASAFFEVIMQGIARVVPDFERSMKGMEIEMLGHVKEGAERAHVVYRLSRPLGSDVSVKIAVTTVERDEVSWKALMNADLEAVARAISSRLSSP